MRFFVTRRPFMGLSSLPAIGVITSRIAILFPYLYTMLDYIIVGLGLAGVSFCETLEEKGKSYRVISDHSQNASEIAAGLYNPVILKRLTLAWEAPAQLKIALPFYKTLEKKLNATLDEKIPVLRRFASVEEQNYWFEACDNQRLQPFLSAQIVENENNAIEAPFGFGEVRDTGRIDTKKLIDLYSGQLLDRGLLIRETFAHEGVRFHKGYLGYKDLRVKRIVFAEGFGLKQNPYFNYLPLTGTKGELLRIKAPELNEKNVIKSSIFIIPAGDDHYRVGATYKWKDKSNVPTTEAREELLQKLNTFLKCDYEVIGHTAGIRPTVTDRRPLAGQHPMYRNMYVLNGFGSRGVMIAPFASQQLFNFIAHQNPIHPEMDICRFLARYRNS